ncbi:MAG TPA: NRDE family protein [Myxococcales bacterium]|nr:NRDE family protein [Myxococcales bacterium]
MCTLALLVRPGELLAASGNRNELLARPASGLAVRGGVLAPRDELAGGSWLGLNRHGLFVCVTNRHGAMIDPSRKSRGLLVMEALQAHSAAGLREALGELRGDRHNGFHLVYADLRDGFVAFCDGERVQHARLEPGRVHVVTERSFGAGEGERERTVAAAFSGLPVTAAAWRPPMTTHAAEPLESACVHADAVGYGTRSSLQLVVRARGAPEALWTDGHPCTNPPRDVAALVTSVLAGAASPALAGP